jgi:glutaredoxin 3
MTQKIEIYTSSSCFYCKMAKRLFNEKKISYIEFDVTNNDDLRKEMLSKSNGSRTVPQIFINGRHIGGCDELYALENDGILDDLLHDK